MDEKLAAEYLLFKGVNISPQKSAVTKLVNGEASAISLKLEQEQVREKRQRIATDEQIKKQREELDKVAAEKQRQALALQKEQHEQQLEAQRQTFQKQQEILQKELEEEKRQMLEARERLYNLKKQVEAEERKVAEAQAKEAETRQKFLEMASQNPAASAALVEQLENAQGTRKAEEFQELEARLKEVEDQKNDLLNQLATLRGGQAHVIPGGSIYIRYCDPYLHMERLKKIDTTLDAERKSKLASIKVNVESLFTMAQDPSFKPIQRMQIKTQLERLKEGAENFEVDVFLRTIKEIQGGNLPQTLLNHASFKQIEQDTQWFDKMRKQLARVGEHQAYKKRQEEVFKIVQEKTRNFLDFFKEYFNETVPETCVLLEPTQTDESAVKDAKHAFKKVLQVSSIPGVKKHLDQRTKFGTTDAFLDQTFMKMGKRKLYDAFKQRLNLYFTLFNGIGQNVKLVEELLNYNLFQKRFQESLVKLSTLDLSQVKDQQVREILIDMRDKNVMEFGETQAAVFAVKVSKILDEYMSKQSVSPGEKVIQKDIQATLINFVNLNDFSGRLRESNPKIRDFHE